jgi:hypothetical protein
MSNGQPDKEVSITLNGSGFPVADPDSAQVKKDNQKERWCSDYEFTLTFENGYSDLSYTSGGTGCKYRCTSGAFGEVQKYKYAITINGKTTDPDVDVKP